MDRQVGDALRHRHAAWLQGADQTDHNQGQRLRPGGLHRAVNKQGRPAWAQTRDRPGVETRRAYALAPHAGILSELMKTDEPNKTTDGWSTTPGPAVRPGLRVA